MTKGTYARARDEELPISDFRFQHKRLTAPSNVEGGGVCKLLQGAASPSQGKSRSGHASPALPPSNRKSEIGNRKHLRSRSAPC